MFGRQNINSSGGTGNNLVEFRAGRMNMIGKIVHPDLRKGLVYLTQSEDGLMHFCWKDRTTGKVEDDLIVFPDDFEFKRVDQCKTGRVYVLKFKSSSRRMFFWMQEPKLDKDDEFCRRVNELMNNPPSTQRNTTDGGDLQYMLNNMSQQQLMQLFGGVGQMGGLSSLLGSMNRSSDTGRNSARNSNGPSAGGTGASAAAGLLTQESTTPTAQRTSNTKTTKATPPTQTVTPAVTTEPKATSSATPGSELKTTSSGPTEDAKAAASKNAGSGRTLNIDFSTALANADIINELISDPELANTLSVHLPQSIESDESKKQQIKDTIQSPQFQQALTLFSNALQSAQLGPVVSQFELTPDAINAAYAGNLEDFVKALEKALPNGATMSPITAVPTPNTEQEVQKEDTTEEKKGTPSPKKENE